MSKHYNGHTGYVEPDASFDAEHWRETAPYRAICQECRYRKDCTGFSTELATDCQEYRGYPGTSLANFDIDARREYHQAVEAAR